MRAITRDSLPHLVDVASRTLARSLSTGYARLAARWWLVDLGADCQFYGRVRMFRHPGSTLSIGERCTFRSSHASNPSGIDRPCLLSTLNEHARLQIGPGCSFSGAAIVCTTGITIGANVRCGPNVWIVDTNGHADTDARMAEDAPIVIGDGVFLGTGVYVMRGVTIGEDTVVAAGSVVTRSLPAGVVAVGSPARVVKKVRGASEPDPQDTPR